jgi:tRNA pseudouridine55 synthase
LTLIDAIEVIWPADASFEVSCSKGTYVRTLAADIGERLGCGAHLAACAALASGRWMSLQPIP